MVANQKRELEEKKSNNLKKTMSSRGPKNSDNQENSFEL